MMTNAKVTTDMMLVDVRYEAMSDIHKKESVASVAKKYGVTRQAIYKWIKLSRRQVKSPLLIKRGRPKSTALLTLQQQEEIFQILSSCMPYQNILFYGNQGLIYKKKYYLWSVDAVGYLISKKFNLKHLKARNVAARILKVWNVIPVDNKVTIDLNDYDITSMEQIKKIANETNANFYFIKAVRCGEQFNNKVKNIVFQVINIKDKASPMEFVVFQVKLNVHNLYYLEFKHSNDAFTELVKLLLRKREEDPLYSNDTQKVKVIIMLDGTIFGVLRQWKMCIKKLNKIPGIYIDSLHYAANSRRRKKTDIFD